MIEGRNMACRRYAGVHVMFCQGLGECGVDGDKCCWNSANRRPFRPQAD